MLLSIFTTLIAIPVIFFNLAFGDISPKVLEKPPKTYVKGIYMTAHTAGWKERRDELVKLIEETELNAIVIDIKDYSGNILYDSQVPLVNELGTEKIIISDLPGLLQELKEKNIYTIARLAVFQDPILAEKKPEWALKDKDGGLWRDWKGLAWVDSSLKEVWDYNLAVAKEAVSMGFDEINLDYIRFPSDGPLDDIVYPFFNKHLSKNDVMHQFFKYFGQNLAVLPVYSSVDLFGMTLWQDDGLNIGQRVEDAAPYFDYICPMVYPSHYPATFEGYKNPAKYPYEIVYESLIRSEERVKNSRAKIRPWLQDFDLGAVYDAEMVKKEIQASYDANTAGWLLWNARNRYTEGALEKE